MNAAQGAGRFSGAPHLVIDADGEFSTQPLVRVAFEEKSFHEDWLQRLLSECPGLLPITDIDERIETPLVSLGREVATESGPLDNLFISRNGQLVIVETKLWRNPEARRKAVVQVIDYAQHVRRWSYSRLCEIAGADVWSRVMPDEHEHGWIDRVNTNLSRGRMTLLVVGDGIRTEAEGLVAAVGERPDFPFRLALVELRVYRDGAGRWLVIPATLAKTLEIERALVTIVGASGNVTVETPRIKAMSTTRRVLSEEMFLDEMRREPSGIAMAEVASKLLSGLDAAAERGLVVHWKSASFTIRGRDPTGAGQLLSLASVEIRPRCGTVSTGIPWVNDQLATYGATTDQTTALSQELVAIMTRFGAKSDKDGKSVEMTLLSLDKREQEFVEALAAFVERVRKTVVPE